MVLFIEQFTEDAVLNEAWHRVQRGGRTPGVDGVTAESFRRNAPVRLARLREEIRTGRYQPAPVLRVEIPKPDGSRRLLGMPTLTDRVAQTAAASVLSDRVALSFSSRSFAYRPFLGPRRAAFYLRSMLPEAEWVVTADIAKFFDNVDHRILRAQLRNAGVDDRGAELIVRWLRAPVRRKDATFQPLKGLPQGAPISPVLANLHLTGFDSVLEAGGFAHVRYADDFIVTAATRDDAERALRFVASYLSSHLKLELKAGKTQLTRVVDGFTFVGYRFATHEWTLPRESVERFKASIGEIIRNEKLNLPDAWRAHNDLVIGWRNYYYGITPEMDAQLADLDGWRADQCLVLLRRHGDLEGVGEAWFEKLAMIPSSTPAPGGYGSPAAAEEVADAPMTIDEWHAGDGMWKTDERARVSAAAIRQAEIGRRQMPELLDAGHLRVPTFGAFIARSRDAVAVRRKKQVLFECALDELSTIVLEADGVALSSTLLDACARRSIPVILARPSGRPYGWFMGTRGNVEARTLRAQLRGHVGRTGFSIAQALLSAKLSNQRALLLYHAKYRRRDETTRTRLVAVAATIADCRRQILELPPGPIRCGRKDLVLIEARAAARYWAGFAHLVPRELGFERRRHPNAGDIVNKCLNYGYALLLTRVWTAVKQARLEPALGILHTGRRGTPGLIFDLMEPFRQPVVDRAVLSLIGRGARLTMNSDGILTMRTRRLLQRAIDRRLVRPTQGRVTVQSAVRQQAIAVRSALTLGRALHAHRMSW